jgi:hypothetical protein
MFSNEIQAYRHEIHQLKEKIKLTKVPTHEKEFLSLKKQFEEV